MEYKVPQNIEVEDRVVGPLTLRQFFILLGAAMICLVLYVALSFFRPLFYLLALIIVGLAIGLAFGNYGDQHPEKLFLAVLSTLSTPRKRVWKRVVDEREMKEAAGKEAGTPVSAGAELSKEKPVVDFDRLSKIIDTGSFADEEVKGRVASLGKKERIPDSEAPKDAIAIKTSEGEGVDSLLTKVEKSAKKLEPLVSQLATVSPNKMFKYDQIDKSGAIEEPIQEAPTTNAK